MCGPKCSELKVKDAKARFEWDPRKLLEQIVTVYLNLSSEAFAESIAQDEVQKFQNHLIKFYLAFLYA